MTEGEVLKKRRQELHMTQPEVALNVGISLQAYQRYEMNIVKLSHSAMKIGLQICAVLELDPYEICFIEN